MLHNKIRFTTSTKDGYSSSLRALITNITNHTNYITSLSRINWQHIEPYVTFQFECNRIISEIRILRDVGHINISDRQNIEAEHLRCHKLISEVFYWLQYHPTLYVLVYTIPVKSLTEPQQQWIQDFIDSSGASDDSSTVEDLSESLQDIGESIDSDTTQYHINLNEAACLQYMHFDHSQLTGVNYNHFNDFKNSEGMYIIPVFINYVDEILHSCKIPDTRKQALYAYKDICSNSEYDNKTLVLNILNAKICENNLTSSESTADLICQSNSFEDVNGIVDLLSSLGEVVIPHVKDILQELSPEELVSPWDYRYLIHNQLILTDYYRKQTAAYFSTSSYDRCLDWMDKHLNIRFVELATTTNIEESDRVTTWHPDVKYYQVFIQDKLLGGVYMDLFSRANKEPSNFYMMSYISRNTLLDTITGEAIIVCNFDHDVVSPADLIDFMHEIGHSIHLLSCESHIPTRGYEALEWDVVEFSSVLLETIASSDINFFKHVGVNPKNGKHLPTKLAQKIVDTLRISKIMDLPYDIRLSLLDLAVHSTTTLYHDYDEVVKVVRKYDDFLPFEDMDVYKNELTTFPHIITGAYSASYYSYILADILVHQMLQKFPDQKECIQLCISELFSRDTTTSFVYEFETLVQEEITPEYLLNYLQITL